MSVPLQRYTQVLNDICPPFISYVGQIKVNEPQAPLFAPILWHTINANNIGHLVKDWDQIMQQKLSTGKGDSKNIDLMELYSTLLDTKDKPLMESYPILYNVLHVHIRKYTDNVKTIRNNINFKIKNLLESFYGEAKDFNLTKLYGVPEILLTCNDEDLRAKFNPT